MTCHRCGRRIGRAEPKLVIGGAWTCAGCVYDAERPSPQGLDEPTREAIRQVDEHADPEWKDRADAALFELARTLPILTPDDLWDVIERPREPRASGPVFLRARKAGWIEPTGRLVRSRNAKQHRNFISEYRSRLCRAPVPAVVAASPPSLGAEAEA